MALPELSKWKRNFEIVQAGLGAIESSLLNEQSHLTELQEEAAEINTRLRSLKKRVAELNFATSENIPLYLRRRTDYSLIMSAPYALAVAQNTAESLRDKDVTTGVRAEPSLGSAWLILEFAYAGTPFQSLRYAAFARNPNVWPPSTGTGAKIYESTVQQAWRLIGTVTTLDAPIRELVLEKTTVRFIKFEHSSHMGFSIVEFE